MSSTEGAWTNFYQGWAGFEGLLSSRPVGTRPVERPASPRAEPAGTPGRPFFSVIVTTWQRRAFLEPAVRSVLGQSVPRSDVQVIVAKGWTEETLDAWLAQCGVETVLTSSPDQGPALAAAMARARGEVVCFLDDDDEFEPDKLAVLRAEFAKDPALVLLRHRNRNIDVEGRALPEWPSCDWPALPCARVQERRTDEEKASGTTLPMHNLSTIAVRRAAVLPFVAAWTEVEAAADSLVFLSALAASGTARADPRVLSRRRIHASSSLENFSPAGAGPPPTLDRLQRLTRSHARQRAMVAGTAAQRSAEWVDLILRFDAAMTSRTFPDPRVSDYLAMLRGIARERQPFRLWVLGFALARRFSPDLAIEGWWRFCHLRHRALFPRVSYPSLFARTPASPAPSMSNH